jgi:hypothetical protein
MRFTRLAIISAALTLVAGTAQAQTTCSQLAQGDMSCATTSSVAITVPYLASASASSINGVTVTVADLNAGGKFFDGASVTVKANFSYAVTATAAGSGQAKAAGANLLIKTGTASANVADYTAIGTGFTIGTGGATSETTINTFHRVILGWTTDAPGSQTYNMTYTVTAP